MPVYHVCPDWVPLSIQLSANVPGKAAKMIQVLGLTLMEETQMEFQAYGFGLAQSQVIAISAIYGHELLDGRSLSFIDSSFPINLLKMLWIEGLAGVKLEIAAE